MLPSTTCRLACHHLQARGSLPHNSHQSRAPMLHCCLTPFGPKLQSTVDGDCIIAVDQHSHGAAQQVMQDS